MAGQEGTVSPLVEKPRCIMRCDRPLAWHQATDNWVLPMPPPSVDLQRRTARPWAAYSTCPSARSPPYLHTCREGSCTVTTLPKRIFGWLTTTSFSRTSHSSSFSSSDTSPRCQPAVERHTISCAWRQIVFLISISPRALRILRNLLSCLPKILSSRVVCRQSSIPRHTREVLSNGPPWDGIILPKQPSSSQFGHE